jgi:hypothetical protein
MRVGVGMAAVAVVQNVFEDGFGDFAEGADARKALEALRLQAQQNVVHCHIGLSSHHDPDCTRRSEVKDWRQ